MKSIQIISIFICVICLVIPALAKENILLEKVHSNADVTCEDCHRVSNPVKKASAKTCKSCHGDMVDSEEVTFKDSAGASHTLNPHNAHPGKIRCTLCHSSHKPSELYCNTCHKFKLEIP